MDVGIVKRIIVLLASVALLPVGTATQGVNKDAVLNDVIAGAWRSADDKSRDGSRRPGESLQFWGLRPGVNILEVHPGAGWWTRILAPYAARSGGRYSATAADLSNPNLPEASRKSRADFAAAYADKNLYGQVELVNWGATAAPLPEASYDLILVSRSIHSWMRTEGMLDRNLGLLARALKKGGMLAIEQHRGNPGPQDPKAASGYVTEAFVIDAVQRAGLKLDARSEVNANRGDTKDHPFGVWTLPPTRTTVPYGSGKPADPTFDRSKYDAIDESDRMTLRFIRPAD